MSTLTITKKTNLVWLHEPSDKLKFILGKFTFSIDGDYFQIIETGQSKRNKYRFSDITIVDEINSQTFSSFANIVELSEKLAELGYLGFDIAFTSGVISVNGNTGIVVLNGTNINVTNPVTSSLTSLNQALSDILASGGGGSQTLQEVLDNNHDLVDGNNFQGTGAGIDNMGVGVTAIGIDAGNNNQGDYLNALGEGAFYGNTGSYSNALGNGAGFNNTFSFVNLFGFNATADENGQTVFSKNGTIFARLSTSLLTATRKYIFPDENGTFATREWVDTQSFEQSSNKATTMTGNTTSNTKYLSAKAVYDWVIGLGYTTLTAVQTWVNAQGFITNVITALGFTPANKSGETFTGSISATNLSGTNTGDETSSSIKTKLGQANTSTDGYISSTDWNTFNNKETKSNGEVLSSAKSLTNTTSAQAIFNASINADANSTYEIEGEVIFSGLSGSSSNLAFSLLGTATISSFLIITDAVKASASASPNLTAVTSNGTVITSNSAITSARLKFQGIIRVTGAGTINPAIAFSIATGTMQTDANSKFSYKKIGSDTVTTF